MSTRLMFFKVSTRGNNDNFQNLYKDNPNCPLKCWSNGTQPVQDKPRHLLLCDKLKMDQNTTVATDKVKYDDMYGNVTRQKIVATLFTQLLACRDKLLDK